MSGPRFLKLTDVAEELSISMSQTYALVKSGDLPRYRLAAVGSGASSG